MDKEYFLLGEFLSKDIFLIKYKNAEIENPSWMMNKSNYLNENFSKSSAKVLWSSYKTTILPIENIKQKDVYLFTSEEIRELLLGILTSSFSFKSNIFTFINNYCEYMLNKGYITINPCSSIDKKSVLKVNKKLLKNEYYSKQRVFKICESLMEDYEDEKGKLYKGCTIFAVLPLILARYGVLGDKFCHIINAKWDWIDRDNMTMNVKDEKDNTLFTVDIDSQFLHWIDEAKNTHTDENRLINPGAEYIDFGYIMKKIETAYNKTKEQKDNTATIYTRFNKAFSGREIKKVKLSSLLDSKKIDMLLEIRKDRQINSADIQRVLETFEECSIGKYDNFKNIYEGLTGDIVAGKSEILQTDRSEEIVLDIKKKLGII